jgi:hypothetical protein
MTTKPANISATLDRLAGKPMIEVVGFRFIYRKGEHFLVLVSENRTIRLTADDVATLWPLIDRWTPANPGPIVGRWTPTDPVRAAIAPPTWAEFAAALLVKPELREHVLGDRAEQFGRDVTRFGRGRAVWLYCRDVAMSVGPSLWTFVKRVGLVGVVVDLYRRTRGL